jgi:hypothetical protein
MPLAQCAILKQEGTFSHKSWDLHDKAIKLEYEHRKAVRQSLSRQKREELKEHNREIARQKAKAKHRGR